MEAFTFNTTELILLSATGVLLIIQLIYYLGLYNRIHTHNLSVGKDEVHFGRELPPLSVVICARNESENLRRNLPTILKQDYPDFEVIVINDGSTDESEDLLSALEEEYPNLYHSFTPDSARYISRKKLALTLGIKASKHDWLVFTEADCAPVSNGSGEWRVILHRVQISYWDIAATNEEKAGCTSGHLSTRFSPRSAIWDLPWQVNRIWASDAIWPTGKSCSSKSRDSLPI